MLKEVNQVYGGITPTINNDDDMMTRMARNFKPFDSLLHMNEVCS